MFILETEAIWVNDEEMIYYRNGKFKDDTHIGCRKVAEDIQPRLRGVEKDLKEKGYKQVYANRFEKYRRQLGVK